MFGHFGQGLPGAVRTVDGTGSGSTRFWVPPEFDANTFSGLCASRSQPQPAELFYTHGTVCTDGICQTHGWTVIMDGQGPITGPTYPHPQKQQPAPDQNCAQSMDQIQDLPPGVEYSAEKLKLLPASPNTPRSKLARTCKCRVCIGNYIVEGRSLRTWH